MIICIQNLVKFCPFILKTWSKNLILESINGRNSVANLRKIQPFTILMLILSMMICIQNLVLFCQFVLKILGKNQILTSINGRNSVALLRKTTIYKTNLDLVTDNVYANFCLILSIRSQDIEQKPNFDVNQGPKLCCQFAKINDVCPCYLKKIQSKMQALECSKDFSHYKSMGIFPDAQGQLTPQSLVRSGRISNSSEMLWMSLLPASMKKIKNEGARVDTTLYSNLTDAQGQITLVLVSVSARNLNSFKLSCMSSLPTRMRMIDSKMKELECSQDLSHYKSMGIFPDAQGQLILQSLVRSGRISKSSEMLWMFSLPASMKKIRSKMKALEWTQHFPHYNPMGAICCHGN